MTDDLANRYGVNESNNLHELFTKEQIAAYRNSDNPTINLDYEADLLKRIVRLRYLSDPGFPAWDLSYCWGELKDGTPCRVTAGSWFHQVPKVMNGRRTPLKAALYTLFKARNLHAKNLGVFDALSTLI